MSIPDETLMAFADGELEGAARAAVEAAMREDPEVEKRIAQHRALRQRIEKAFAAELSEPVPEHLVLAANRAPGSFGSKVVDLGSIRDSKQRPAAGVWTRASWWQPLGAIAAGVIIGFGLGYGGRHQSTSPLIRGAGGAVVASGELEQALSHQLTAEQSPGTSVKIGISFLAKSGEYCRTFSLSGSASPSGLACHHGQEWQIQALSQSAEAAAGDIGYRTAASGMPPAILKAVEDQISGEPLDPAAESRARSTDWKSAR
jgi:hypothetical protein